MHKFKVKFNLGGGTAYIFADDMATARKLALVEYRRNGANIAYGLENHTVDQVIDTIEMVD